MVIKVIDSIMGSGKSTWSHKYMYENKDKKFIYITPYLNEIERLIGTSDNRTVMYTERNFREPKHMGDGKLEGLHKLLVSDHNVATTHALFRMSTQETIDLISSGEYTLILDEALEVFDFKEMKVKDYEMLLETNKIKVNENMTIEWTDEEYDGDFIWLKKLCENGTVIELKRTKNVQMMVWNFKAESFLSFKEVFIMTYLFESSFLKYYLDMHKIEFDKYCIENGELIKFENKKPYNKSKYRDLIEIYQGNLNTIGDKETALSLSWFKNNSSLAEKLRNNLYNYIRNVTNAKSDQIFWTTFKSAKKSMIGKGYTKGFVVCNVKATNDYVDKNILAYCCNRYASPDYFNYFFNYEIVMDEDLYALSEMIQWIWRSAIRIGEPIKLYIPSSRMRGLLVRWLNNENI